MRDTPTWDFLHSREDSSTGPPLADYPIPLLTRRTLGEMAGGILAARQHAPQGIALHSAAARPRNV